MKGPVVILPRFFLLCIVVFIFLMLFQYIGYSGLSTPAEKLSVESWSLNVLSLALQRSIVPAVLFSVFLSLFGITKSRSGLTLSILLLIVSAGAVLIPGVILTDRLCDECGVEINTFPFKSSTIHRVENGAIYVETANTSDHELNGLIYVELSKEDPFRRDKQAEQFTLNYFDHAYFSSSDRIIVAGGESIVVEPTYPITSPLVEASGSVSKLISQVLALSLYLRTLKSASFGSFLALSMALVAFSASCGWLAVVSRWRLVNALLIGLMIRATFLLFTLFTGDIVDSLALSFHMESLARHLPAISFGVIAVLFLAIGAFLISEKE